MHVYIRPGAAYCLWRLLLILLTKNVVHVAVYMYPCVCVCVYMCLCTIPALSLASERCYQECCNAAIPGAPSPLGRLLYPFSPHLNGQPRPILFLKTHGGSGCSRRLRPCTTECSLYLPVFASVPLARCPTTRFASVANERLQR